MNFPLLFTIFAGVFSCFALAGLLVLWVSFVIDRVNNEIKQGILILTPVATVITIVLYSVLSV